MRLAIVVPTLDEAATIAERVRSARRLGDRVVVSDGGSADDTVERARAAGATVVEGPAGRGGQLNRGAAAAGDADAYLFLHADTELAPDAGDRVRRALETGRVGGGFEIRFASARPILGRLGTRLVNLRTRLTRCPLGDQAQFVGAETFRALGGFRDWPILEDLDFARRLKRRGRVAVLTPPAVTSARRFERLGITRTLATNWLIFALYFLGAPPARLARLYRGRPAEPPAAPTPVASARRGTR